MPSLRTAAKRSTRRWERSTVKGIRPSVSLQAKPTIIPWSPAPVDRRASAASPLARCSRAVVTPWLMSADCWLTWAMTPQEPPSSPYLTSV